MLINENNNLLYTLPAPRKKKCSESKQGSPDLGKRTTYFYRKFYSVEFYTH